MIVHHTRLRKNGDLHLWETAALNVRASIMRQIMRSKDVQCSNKKYVKTFPCCILSFVSESDQNIGRPNKNSCSLDIDR